MVLIMCDQGSDASVSSDLEDIKETLEPAFTIELNTPNMNMTEFELYETTLAVVFDYNCVQLWKANEDRSEWRFTDY
jgi:hypothetical protein